MSRGFPKRSFSFIDGMALFRKVKCAGLTFDKVAKEIFNAARTYTSWSKRILFSISTRTVARSKGCPNVLSFKKIIGTMEQ